MKGREDFYDRSSTFWLKYAELFTGHDSARGSGQAIKKLSWVESSRVRRWSQCRGSGRVGSGVFKYDTSGQDNLTPFNPTRPDPTRLDPIRSVQSPVNMSD